MLVLIGVTLLTTAMTKLRRRQGVLAKGRRHNKGHQIQQQQDSNEDFDDNASIPTTTTTKVRQR